MKPDFFIKKNDTGRVFEYRLPLNAVLPQNATVKFYARYVGRTMLAINETATVVSYDPPVVSYDFAKGGAERAGDLIAEFEVTDNQGKIATYPLERYLIIKVLHDLGDGTGGDTTLVDATGDLDRPFTPLVTGVAKLFPLILAAGALAAPAAVASGAGTLTPAIDAEGALRAAPASVEGSGTNYKKRAGSGAVTAPPADVDGSGFRTLVTSYQATAPFPAVAGEADRIIRMTSFGRFVFGAASASGVGERTLTGNGLLVNPLSPDFVGVAVREVKGSGSVTGSLPLLQGSSFFTYNGAGDMYGPTATLEGLGSIDAAITAGAISLTAPSAEVDGAGLRGVKGSSQIIAPLPLVEGTTNTVRTATGDMKPQFALVEGLGLRTVVWDISLGPAPAQVSGSGLMSYNLEIFAPAALVSGTSDSGKYGEGGVTATFPLVSGQAEREQKGTGALAAPAAYTTGLAVIPEPVTGEGALAAPPASVDGTGDKDNGLWGSADGKDQGEPGYHFQTPQLANHYLGPDLTGGQATASGERIGSIKSIWSGSHFSNPSGSTYYPILDNSYYDENFQDPFYYLDFSPFGAYLTGGETLNGGSRLFADATDAFTVFACFRSNPNSSGSGTIVAKGGGDGTLRQFQVGAVSGSSGRRIEVRLRGVNNHIQFEWMDDVWHCVVVTWNGEKALVEIDNTPAIEVNVGTAAEEVGQNINLGARTNGTGFFFDHYIGETFFASSAIDQKTRKEMVLEFLGSHDRTVSLYESLPETISGEGALTAPMPTVSNPPTAEITGEGVLTVGAAYIDGDAYVPSSGLATAKQVAEGVQWIVSDSTYAHSNYNGTIDAAEGDLLLNVDDEWGNNLLLQSNSALAPTYRVEGGVGHIDFGVVVDDHLLAQQNIVGNSRLMADNDDRFTVFAIFRKPVSGAGAGVIIGKSGSSSSLQQFQIHSGGDGTITAKFRGLNSLNTNTTYHDGNWHIAVATWDGFTCHLEIDNDLYLTASPGTEDEEPNEPIVVGARTSGTGFHWDDRVGDIVIVDHRLTHQNRQEIAAEMMQRYGVTLPITATDGQPTTDGRATLAGLSPSPISSNLTTGGDGSMTLTEEPTLSGQPILGETVTIQEGTWI